MRNITLIKYLFFLVALIAFSDGFAQPNSESYKYSGDTLKYRACKKAEEIKGHYQFSKSFQSILDESIAIDPGFDYPYLAKSVAYLKSGDFIRWKKLIDKAVELDPISHLGYRGWCRYQFFRDYAGAIRDIEEFDRLVPYDIGHSQNGTYHLNMAKALCYKAMGEKDRAIRIMEAQLKLNEEDDFVGPYDYIHLGVLYLEKGLFKQALKVFKKQSELNVLAENQYYSALAYKLLNQPDAYKACIDKAKELHRRGYIMFDSYSNPMDKVYINEIECERKKAYQ